MEQYIIPLLALVAMEIVLGIDNVVFIAILTDRLPENEQSKARKLGLTLALVARIILLFSISWVMGLTSPLFAWTDVGIPDSLLPEIPAAAAHVEPEPAETAADTKENTDPKEDDAEHVVDHATEIRTVSGRDLILLLGGLFLIFKTVKEIDAQMSGQHHHSDSGGTATFKSVIFVFYVKPSKPFSISKWRPRPR